MAAKKATRMRDKKVTIVFDEAARREYLLGFRKRKNERRKKAQEQLQKMEREKKKQTREERKKMFVEQVEKQRKELEALESDDSSDDIVMPSVNATFEHPEHIVTVTTIDDIDLTQDRSSSFRRSMGKPENSNKSFPAPRAEPVGKLVKGNSGQLKKRKYSNKAKSKKEHGQKGFSHKGRKGKASGKKRKGSKAGTAPESSKRAKRF